MDPVTRIEDVEVKLAYLERYVSELDAVVRSLGDQLARIEKDVAALAAQAQGGGETPSGGHEVPPHY